MNNIENSNGREIAVIGMACRFPGAKSINEFWNNLINGVESISEFSDQELEASGVNSSLFKSQKYVRKGFILNDIEYFDPVFFGYSEGEAEIMDPQQRIFLECAWEAMEDAGYDPENYSGLIGVYAGMGVNSYLLKKFHADVNNNNSIKDFQIFITNEKDFLSTRVSYTLNLRGPSLTIQTACSTSLVCIHSACMSLLNYECDMALAGAVSISIPQKVGYYHQFGMIYSTDGRCKAFDADARGMVNGNGAGIVILKRLNDALADRDCIHALVKGSSVNNDGSFKIGYAAPSIDSQAEVIADAQAVAEISPDTITYIEAHGTGTPLGDPIEIAALTKAFSIGTKKKGFCAVGSVKTNIGHLNAAAGVAGFIKTVLALKHKKLPSSLNFNKANPKINFEETPFYVNTQLAEWKTNGAMLRAGVSSFGIGGTNAHVVLEEMPVLNTFEEKNSHYLPWHLLILSAKTYSALENITHNYAMHLRSNPDLKISDMAYTLQLGRKKYEYSKVIVCTNLEDAIHKLEAKENELVISEPRKNNNRPIIFLLSGQWSKDSVKMLKDIYDLKPRFSKKIDSCIDMLKSEFGVDMSHLLDESQNIAEESEIKNKEALSLLKPFIIEYALAMMWISWGVNPTALLGRDVGIFAASCVAGLISLKDSLELIIAGEKLIPLSTIENIDIEKARLEFDRKCKNIKLNSPHINLFSSMLGKQVTLSEAADHEFWIKHLLKSSCLDNEIDEALRNDENIFLEIGYKNRISTEQKNNALGNEGQSVFFSYLSKTSEIPTLAFLLKTLGQIWLSGVNVDWKKFNCDFTNYRVSLPTYPFERKRCWFDNSIL